MEPDLRRQFDLAVSADPGVEPGQMASSAMLHGGRIRNRRRLAVAGLAVAVVTGVVATSALNVRERTEPPAMVAAAMRLPAPECSANPVTENATDAVIYLYDESDGQRTAIGRALDGDERVAAVVYENREQVWARFVELWKDSPDFLAAVQPRSLPVSYRVRLHDQRQFTDFQRSYATRPGVRQIIGRICPASAPIGGAVL